jgi:hypothetical protein
MTFISSSIPSQGTQQLNNHPLMRPQKKQTTDVAQKPASHPATQTPEASKNLATAPQAAVKKTSQLPDMLARKVHDIQHVAQKMGYVDLSEGAVVSAMRENRSLLADYRA